MTLVLGQAAQGKSTAAACWAKHSSIPTAWVNLDADSSDPVSLFYLIVYSLELTLKGANLSDLWEYPSTRIGPRDEIPLYREWSRAILQRVNSPLHIVFDGLNRLSNGAPSFRFLQVLMEELPTEWLLVLISRMMPPLEMQRLKMARGIMVVDNEQLAFTASETRAFFKKLHGMRLSSYLLRKIQEMTEGWVGGLILFAGVMKSEAEDVQEKLLEGGLSSGRFRREVFDYMGEQIFQAQPEPLKDLLMKLSVFEVIDSRFLRDRLKLEDAAEVLDELERKNLFVHSLYGAEGSRFFRFHQLFRDFLRLRFRTSTGQEERTKWVLRAGSACEQAGELESALKLYMEIKAYAEAARVIVALGMRVFRAGRTGELSRWLSKLPEDMVQESPWLLLYSCMTTRYTSTRENVSKLQKALSVFEERNDARGCLLSLAYLIEALIVSGYFSIPLGQILDKAEMTLQTLSGDANRYERATLCYQVGFGQILCNGEPRKGIWACENAYVMAKELGDVPLQINALIHIIGGYTPLGDFSPAKEICGKVEELLKKYPYPEIQSLYYIHGSIVYTWSGDLEKAREMVSMARRQVEEHGLLYLYPITLLYDLIARSQLEEYSEAETIGNRLIDLGASFGNLFLRGIVTLFLGLSYYRKGDFQVCLELMEQSREILSSPEARAVYHVLLSKIVTSLASFHLHHGEENHQELQQVLDHLTSITDHSCVAQGQIAMAFLKHREGSPGEAATHLEAGLLIAEEQQYHYFWILSKRDVVRACVLAVELDIKAVSGYVKLLLTTRFGSLAMPELARLREHKNPGVRRRALDLIRSIRRSSLPHVRIEAFGPFRVMVGETLMDEGEWGGRQPKLLLEMLVCHGASGAPKDLLMEDLWRKGSQSKVEGRFKVILHSLRKVLEPSLDNRFGSSYVHLKGGIVSLDRELCTVDVDEFLSLYEAGCQKESEGDLKGALSVFECGEELCKGDFVCDELYVDEINARRDELRGRHIELLCKMAQIHETHGSSRKAVQYHRKVIQVDPLFEPAYQRLMALYLNRTMRNEAIKVYEECRKALHSELGVEPDELTTAIYRKALETH